METLTGEKHKMRSWGSLLLNAVDPCVNVSPLARYALGLQRIVLWLWIFI